MADIVIENLRVAYGGNVVFDGMDMTLKDGAVNVILGGSGVGKTTLLNAVSGLVPHGGTIRGADVGISYIFQKDRLIPSISVYKNLDLVLKNKIADKRERRVLIENMLAKLEILSEIDKFPGQLSGGQAQRVSMARAFLYPSGLLLMDEPFRALDAGLKIRLLREFGALLADSPRTVVFVTHDIEECLLAADAYFVLEGAPASIALHGVIDVPRGERKPSDAALASVRGALLKTLTGEGR